jgi:hypothetical protein
MTTTVLNSTGVVSGEGSRLRAQGPDRHGNAEPGHRCNRRHSHSQSCRRDCPCYLWPQDLTSSLRILILCELLAVFDGKRHPAGASDDGANMGAIFIDGEI